MSVEELFAFMLNETGDAIDFEICSSNNGDAVLFSLCNSDYKCAFFITKEELKHVKANAVELKVKQMIKEFKRYVRKDETVFG